jgi:hypothetical protein
MRIAQIAPLSESVPPKLYGGTERVVSCLVDELVEPGQWRGCATAVEFWQWGQCG